MKEERRKNVKTVVSLVTGVGAGVLLGAVGGTMIRNLNANVAIKILASLGWFGLSNKLINDAQDGMEDYIDNVFEILDTIEQGGNVKVV